MKLKKSDIDGLNVAFNEANFIGAEIDKKTHSVALTLAGIWLDADGQVPRDRRVQVILRPVGKLQASLRNSRWDDALAAAVPFPADQLLEIVQSFKSQPIYGWEFFDRGEQGMERWKDRISLNYEAQTEGGRSHTLDLFQDTSDKILDLRIWFDEIGFFTADQKAIPLRDFIALGKRGWDALMIDNNKEIQDAFGIYPGAPDKSDETK